MRPRAQKKNDCDWAVAAVITANRGLRHQIAVMGHFDAPRRPPRTAADGHHLRTNLEQLLLLHNPPSFTYAWCSLLVEFVLHHECKDSSLFRFGDCPSPRLSGSFDHFAAGECMMTCGSLSQLEACSQSFQDQLLPVFLSTAEGSFRPLRGRRVHGDLRQFVVA